MSGNVVVIGGSIGIGAAIVRKFAINGYNVVLTYNTSEKDAYSLAAELSQKAMVFVKKCDIRDKTQINELYEFVKKNLNGIDILVNNAGIPCYGQLGDLSCSQIEETINVNLLGTILVTKELLPLLRKKDKASIINISSIWGVYGGAMESVYSASKAGIIGFTKALAKELGPCGIRVNCVAPGYIETDMNKDFSFDDKEDIRKRTALLELGKPSNIADAVYFLASTESYYITGQVLQVDGFF